MKRKIVFGTVGSSSKRIEVTTRKCLSFEVRKLGAIIVVVEEKVEFGLNGEEEGVQGLI